MQRLLIALSISAAATGVLASQETPPVAAVETIAAVSAAQTTMTAALGTAVAGPTDAASRAALPAADGKTDGSDGADGSITAAFMLMMAVVILRRRVANGLL